MPHNLRCTFCGGEISVNHDYQKVEGFERKRNQGGTNAIRLRITKAEWACRRCIDRESRGINANQGAMV